MAKEARKEDDGEQEKLMGMEHRHCCHCWLLVCSLSMKQLKYLGDYI